MKKDRKHALLTLPNLLSILRILLSPVILFLMVHRKTLAALIVFSLAGLTDFLDGLTARVWSQKTKIGAILDPAADKLLMTTSFVLLSIPAVSQPNMIPLWLTVVVIFRDIMIASGSYVMYRIRGQKNFIPSLLGKISTACQVGTVFFVLLLNSLKLPFPSLRWLFYFTLAFTLLSGTQYVLMGFRLFFRRKGV